MKLSSSHDRLPKRPGRPHLEVLEDRTLLSVCLVDRLTDLGEGSGLTGDLRYCLAQTAAGDRITFGVEGTINLTGVLPALTRSVSIEGPGPDRLTVRRATGGDYRIFDVAAGTAVTLSGLTIANGFVQGTRTQVYGGGILNRGTLTLENATLADNVVQAGGMGGALASGGGVYNAPGGTLTVRHSTLTRNVARIVNASFGIFDPVGGGLSNEGTAAVSHSILSENLALFEGLSGEGGEGGGISNGFEDEASLTLTASTVAANQGTGIFNWFGSMTLNASTIAANQGDSAGGIWNVADLIIHHSTISGNAATAPTFGTAGGILNLGGIGGGVRLFSSTISNNTAVSINNSANQIHTSGTDSVRLRNTILSGDGQRPNVRGPLTSEGYNLSSDRSGNLAGPGDLEDVDPLLGPLADNGGPTLTHALLPGSPAINAGEPGFGTGLDFPKWDQRGGGFYRVASGRLDIGGFEVQGRAVADFDGDGWSDLAVANYLSNDVSILRNAAEDAAFFYLDTRAQVPAGQPFDLTVYALSADWRRLAHGYRGTVAFWSSDAQAALPAPHTFRPTDYGVASFPGGVPLRTPGTQYLAAFDLATFAIIGYAVVDVAAPDGSPGTFGVGAGFADLIAALQGNKGLSRHRDVLSELLPL